MKRLTAILLAAVLAGAVSAQTPAPPPANGTATLCCARNTRWASPISLEGVPNLHQISPNLYRSEQPTALEPGRRYTVRVLLDAAAQRVPRGARLRVAISSSYWPMVLPSPEPVNLTIHTGSSRIVLPTRPERSANPPAAATPT